MGTTAKHRMQQHQKVIDAARKCFVRHGFHATGMAEIAKACRMSVGNIYHYFPHKNAIVQAITDEVRSRLFPALKDLASHADPLPGLVEVMLHSLQEIGTNSNARLWMEISAEASRNPVIRKTCLAFDRDFRKILESLLKRALAAGQLPAGTDSEWTALWLVALLDGATARLSMEPDLDVSRLQDRMVQTLRDFFRIKPVRCILSPTRVVPCLKAPAIQ
ncbi:MAG TPA: TetR/AcrR family transcriptional regulator [Verrucomicrobiota bacterium]|nr:TetR/AcrR family transcriptional regulator [Verrucomicrobiota bacterium]